MHLAQSVDDGAALLGDAFALEVLGFRLGLGVLHHQDLVGLALRGRGDLQALLRLDFVHRRLDVVGRIDVGDERVGDLEAVDLHRHVELALHRGADVVLLLEHLVEVHLRNLGAHDVEDIGLDLLDVVLELVVGIRLAALDDAELHRDEKLHEDVVERLGLDLDDAAAARAARRAAPRASI